MDAVFKLLHVEVARKATDGNQKKKMIKFSKIKFLWKKKYLTYELIVAHYI